jgi:hypothetical protein
MSNHLPSSNSNEHKQVVQPPTVPIHSAAEAKHYDTINSSSPGRSHTLATHQALEPDFNPFAKMNALDEDDPTDKIKSMDQTSAFNIQIKMA